MIKKRNKKKGEREREIVRGGRKKKTDKVNRGNKPKNVTAFNNRVVEVNVSCLSVGVVSNEEQRARAQTNTKKKRKQRKEEKKRDCTKRQHSLAIPHNPTKKSK